MSKAKGQQKSCLSPTGGAMLQQGRRPSAGVIKVGLSVAGQDRRPSATSYLATDFPNNRRASAVSIVQAERRESSELVHHSCLNPAGSDTENARRRPSYDMFHQPCLAPGGSDNEKARRRPSVEPIHHSCLNPLGTDSEKARRRPSTDMFQMASLAPGGSDSDQTRRRLSIQTQTRRASVMNELRRPSMETEDRRGSMESQGDRRPSTENNQAYQVGESSHPVTITKQLYDITLDERGNDEHNPSILVTTIEEDGEQDLAEADQWVRDKEHQQPSVQQSA